MASLPYAIPVHPSVGKESSIARKLYTAHSSKHSLSEEMLVKICTFVEPSTKLVLQRISKERDVSGICKFHRGSIVGRGLLVAM